MLHCIYIYIATHTHTITKGSIEPLFNSITGPNGNNLGGNTTTTVATTTTTTTGVPIFTIPTVFPTATSRTTTGSMPITERLVVDINGNAISGQSSSGNGRTIDSKYLLILLSLVPLLGAFGLQNSRGAAVAQPVHVVPSVPYSWATAVRMHPIQFQNTFGFGNFNPGGSGLSGTSAYAGKNYEHGVNSGLNGVISNNVYPNNMLQTQNTQAMFNNGAYFNNVGNNFVQNPVLWNRNDVTVNNGFTSHVFPRSTGSLNGAPHKPSSGQYANPSRSLPSPPIRNEYSNNNQHAYTPNGNFVPSNPGIPAGGKTWRHTNGIGQRNQWQHSSGTSGSTNWLNNGINQGPTRWQNNGEFNGRKNNFNKHGVGIGQRLTVPETIPQRMHIVSSDARFQTNNPRQIIDASHPLNGGNVEFKSSNTPIQNGGRLLNAAFSTTRNGRLTGNTLVNGVGDGTVNQEPVFVHDWYNMLVQRYPGRETRLL